MGVIPGIPSVAGSLRKGKHALGEAAEVAEAGKVERKAAAATPETLKDWSKVLSDAQSRVYSEAEALHLGGEHKGLIYEREGAPSNKGAHEFQKNTSGVKYDPDTNSYSVPALRYENSSPTDRNFIRFDAAEMSKDGVTLIIKDAKKKMAILFGGMQETTLDDLRRVREAVMQNPGFKVVYEFPDEKEAEIAREFLKEKGFKDYIQAIARVQ
jgi:filamentous hemagglutinin